jgi:hypothetical protein
MGEEVVHVIDEIGDPHTLVFWHQFYGILVQQRTPIDDAPFDTFL